MSKNIFAVILFSFLVASVQPVLAWGVWGHQHINKAAIFALPPEEGVFFYNHADFITEEAVVPDIRKHAINDKAEPNRHYIDLEGFNYKSWEDMPQTLSAAIEKFSNDTVQKYGILPWYIIDMTDKLTKAFKEKSKTEILFLAADLGHYLGDATMPLHTSLNHDGQFTDQKGIHSFWEAQLPEIFGDNYNLNTGEAHYVDDIKKTVWTMIAHTHSLVDTLLLADRQLKESFPKDKIYVMDSAGKIARNKYNQPIHTREYSQKYHELLNGMVEKQMRTAIAATADFWYTAWVNAGKPDLSVLDPESLTERNKHFYKEDKKAWEKGSVTEVKNNEF